jgi:hypothetical protein
MFAFSSTTSSPDAKKRLKIEKKKNELHERSKRLSVTHMMTMIS